MQDNKRSTWLRRLPASLLAAAALVLTFFFFSPTEMTLLNPSSFRFSATGAVMPIMGLFSVAAIAFGAAVLALFRGKLHNVLVALCLAAALCLYVQGTFMTGTTPPLSGDDVDWAAMNKARIVNLVEWVVIFSIPFILLRFKQVWGYARILLPALIIIMQLTGFISLIVRPDLARTDIGYLSYDGFCDYSDEGNTLVIMLDRLDFEYIEGVLEQDPGFFDRMDGFTRYDNAISQYAHTRPGMNFILTNYDETMFKEPAVDFFEHSWDDGERHILKDLTDAGYDINLFGSISSLLGKNYAGFTPYVSNIRLSSDNIRAKKVIQRMTMLSAYRCFPLALKPMFYKSSTWYDHVFKKGSNSDPDMTVYDQMMPGMTVQSDHRCFKFYEFQGSHTPYTLNADGTKAKDKTDVVTQTMGSFEILYRAFDAMKQASVYKDTAIIITADHGYMRNDYKPLEAPVRIGIFYKPAGVEGTPFQTSYAPVSLRNIPATVLKSAGLDYTAYGVPLDEVPDDKSIVRDYVRSIADKSVGWIDCWALYYDVAYDAADMDSWTLTRTEKIEYPLSF